MNKITIPNYKTLDIQNIVLDYNGTIAFDGVMKESVKKLISELAHTFRVHIITADTFGSVASQSEGLDITLKILSSDDHTQEKAEYIKELGAEGCVAFGNGNNDALMLESAVVGIAIMGEEGCTKDTLLSSDIICHSIEDALALVLHPKRLIATLRR